MASQTVTICKPRPTQGKLSSADLMKLEDAKAAHKYVCKRSLNRTLQNEFSITLLFLGRYRLVHLRTTSAVLEKILT